MTLPLALLLTNAVLGAWDTLWYHEYRARLTSRLATTRNELQLHVGRDAIYTGIYGLLAFAKPQGWMVVVVALAFVAEIVITLTDFVVEDRDRPSIGGMAAGERVLHSLMAIVYGGVLFSIAPELMEGLGASTGWVDHGAPRWMSLAAVAAAIGIALSGARDALALAGVSFGLRPVVAVRVGQYP